MKQDWGFRHELKPRDVAELTRLGHPSGDGGYVVPRWAVDTTDVILTLGIGHEWSFEEDLLRRRPGVSIVGVDHTLHAASMRWSLRQAQVKHAVNRLLGRTTKVSRYEERIREYRLYERLFTAPHLHIEKAVGPVGSATTVTIDELFKRLKPSNPHRVLVSMDIEGAEYDLVGALVRHHAAINMIVTEFHHVGRHLAQFERSITEIKKLFDIVHLHGNNFAPYNQDLDFPEVIEMTFVHRSLMPPDSPYSSLERPLPGLDVANRPGSPDYVLRI